MQILPVILRKGGFLNLLRFVVPYRADQED